MNISSPINQIYTPPYISPAQAANHAVSVENTAESHSSPEPSLETIKKLSSLVLGKDNIKRWEAKGLELSDAVYEKAYEAFNEAFKWGNSHGLSNISLSFNAHDIIASTQDVPAWFEAERSKSLSQLQHIGVQEAFANHALWYGHINSVFA